MMRFEEAYISRKAISGKFPVVGRRTDGVWCEFGLSNQVVYQNTQDGHIEDKDANIRYAKWMLGILSHAPVIEGCVGPVMLTDGFITSGKAENWDRVSRMYSTSDGPQGKEDWDAIDLA